jgi:ribosomal protein L11 methyltransferase
MMNWKLISIDTSEENADIVASVLMDAGAGGVEIKGGSVPEATSDEYSLPDAETDEVSVSAYFGEDGADELAEALRARLDEIFPDAPPSMTVTTVPDTDWNENFRRNFTAFRAAGCFIIKPSWEEYQAEKDDIVLEIDPGMAFGTGDHESTRMCLELLQKYMTTGSSVLDVGTGSGILSIAAMKLGASRALALDYDPVSVKVAAENAAVNGVVMEARQSDLLQNADGGPYDMVLANIVADILIRLNRGIAPLMTDGGIYILGGIIEERLKDVTDSLTANGFDIIETRAMAAWRAVAARKS